MEPKATKRGREDDRADGGSSSVRARLDGSSGEQPSWPALEEESCPIDSLPDELLVRILVLAARREWQSQPACAGMRKSQLGPRESAPDARPELLQRYRRVCRRFRSLCEDPSAWERIALRKPCPSDLEALLGVPDAARRGARRVQVYSTVMDSETLGRLRECFPGAVSELELWFDLTDPKGRARPRLGIPPLAAFSELRSLSLRASDESSCSSIEDHSSTYLEESLPAIASLSHIHTLDLSGLPIALEHLHSLRGLAPTLRALSVAFCPQNSLFLLSQGVTELEVEPMSCFVALSSGFRALERLRVEFWGISWSNARRTHPVLSRDAAAPLARLASLRALEIGGVFVWIGFLPSLTRLEHVTLELCGGTDIAPLAALAPTLRSLALNAPVADPAALCNVLRRLYRLQACARPVYPLLFPPHPDWPPPQTLELSVPGNCLEQLAVEPLSCWAELEVLQLACYLDGDENIPASLIQRLGTDARALRRLKLESPLVWDAETLASTFGSRRRPRRERRWVALRSLGVTDDEGEQLRGDLLVVVLEELLPAAVVELVRTVERADEDDEEWHEC
eukprot:tig00000113_g5665.t1